MSQMMRLADMAIIERLRACCDAEKMEVMQVSAKMEAEIAALESEAERREFLKDLGIEEPALGQLTRLCLKALGLMSFFTVGEDEVRQWLIRRNATAPEAAGAIHSDLQRGFIRAEVFKYGRAHGTQKRGWPQGRGQALPQGQGLYSRRGRYPEHPFQGIDFLPGSDSFPGWKGINPRGASP